MSDDDTTQNATAESPALDCDATEHRLLNQRRPAAQPHRAGDSDQHTSQSLQGKLHMILQNIRNPSLSTEACKHRRPSTPTTQRCRPPWQPHGRTQRPDYKVKCEGSGRCLHEISPVSSEKNDHEPNEQDFKHGLSQLHHA